MMKWFAANYLNSPAEVENARISLVKASVHVVAPATVVTAQIDPLRSEGQEYAEHLRARVAANLRRVFAGGRITAKRRATAAAADPAVPLMNDPNSK